MMRAVRALAACVLTLGTPGALAHDASALRCEPAAIAPHGESVLTLTRETPDGAGPLAGRTVRVAWRPGLAGAREASVGITDARGQVRWDPDDSGPAWIRVDGEPTPCRIHVGWPAPPLRIAVPAVALVAGALGILWFVPAPARSVRRTR